MTDGDEETGAGEIKAILETLSREIAGAVIGAGTEWNSLNFVRLIVAIEKRFKITFCDDELEFGLIASTAHLARRIQDLMRDQVEKSALSDGHGTRELDKDDQFSGDAHLSTQKSHRQA